MSNRHHFTNSSAVSHCDYHDDDGLLEICFMSGSTHHFKCDKGVYEDFKNSKSAGKHFHMHIRGKHKEVKR